MKRILLAVVAAACLLGGGLLSTAQAHGPQGHHGHNHGGFCRPSYGYGGYRGPYSVYAPRIVPYGAGYAGGYQPYQNFYYQRQQPRFGLYFGF